MELNQPSLPTASRPFQHGHRRGHNHQILPPWIREVDVLLPVTRQFILSGNIEDYHLVGSADGARLQAAGELIVDCAKTNGFDLIYSYDPVDGIVLEFERTEGTAETFFSPTHLERSTSATVGKMADLMRKAMLGGGHRVAILMHFAGRIWRDEQHAGPDLRTLFALSEKIAHAQPVGQPPLGRPESIESTVFWLAGQDAEAPRWLTDGDRVRTLSVAKPELGTRRAAAAALMGDLPGFKELPPEQAESVLNTFARLSDGMVLRDLSHVVHLAVDAEIPAANVEEAIRSLRLGVPESPQ